jgi:hypothetical protein
MTKLDWVACSLIIFSVILIGFGGAEKVNGDSEEVSYNNLFFALGFSLMVGVLLTFNSLNVNFILTKIKFPPD